MTVIAGCDADDQPCAQTSPSCDQGELVSCVDGQEARRPCSPEGYCSYGECVPTSIRFPDDVGPHENRSEWWYYTGHVETEDGARYSFEVTIFQYLLEAVSTYMCHVAVTDHEAGLHSHVAGIDFGTTTWTTDPVVLEVLACRFELGDDGRDHIVGTIAEGAEADGLPGGWVLDLEVAPTKPVAIHGGDGVIGMSDAGGESWYYSRTRLEAEGTLAVPGGDAPLAVSGQAWTDHQWGEFDVNQFEGWDWWSMQLDDGWEVMLFQFRDWDSVLVYQAGSLVDPAGNVTELEGFEDYSVASRRTWASTHTDGVYPLDWDIDLTPAGDAEPWHVEVVTAVDDQEMHNLAQNYWEGAVTVTGTRGSEPIEGVGFVELTGYATDSFDP